MLHVRSERGVERVDAAGLVALATGRRLRASSPVALSEAGPFAPLGPALEASGALRDELSRALPIPSLRGYGRLRLFAAAALLSSGGMAAVADGELLLSGKAGPARIGLDLAVLAFAAAELSRATPRARGVLAVALAGLGLRWLSAITHACGRGVGVGAYVGAALAMTAAVVWLVRVPSASRVALELASKLGIGRSELFRATAEREPPPSMIAAAVACAAALPALLHAAQILGLGPWTQALGATAFGLGAPLLARRALEPERAASPRRPLARTLVGAFTGFALAAAALTASGLFFDTGTELARCVRRLDTGAAIARAAQAAEVASAIATARASTPLFVLTAVVLPFVEERVFRGLLLDVLARRYGRAYGVLAASLAFGVAHLGIYQVALYQTALLGAAFAIAWLEGGLVAAVLAHAAWNVLQLVG